MFIIKETTEPTNIFRHSNGELFESYDDCAPQTSHSVNSDCKGLVFYMLDEVNEPKDFDWVILNDSTEKYPYVFIRGHEHSLTTFGDPTQCKTIIATTSDLPHIEQIEVEYIKLFIATYNGKLNNGFYIS